MRKTIITFLLALVFPITASAQLESDAWHSAYSTTYTNGRKLI